MNIMINSNRGQFLPEPGLKQNKVRQRKAESRIGLPVLKVFPNPTKEYMIIECVLESVPRSKILQLMNSSGQLVLEQALDHLNNYCVVDLRRLPTGSYTGRIIVDGKVIGSIKVVVNK